jgi:branched-chain amino acid transport system substrate-binding protein
MRRRRLLTLSLAAPILWVAPALARPKDVVIGFLYPLSGPAASGALDDRRIFELFADMVNGGAPMLPGPFYRPLRGLSGFRGGARLRLVFADHQGAPDRGRVEAERLITREGVHALVGAWQSRVTAAASQVAERFGVPFLTAEATEPGLTRRGFKWFLRTSPHDEHFAQAMFDFLADFRKKTGRPLETVAITHADTRRGGDFARVQGRLARRYGYRIVAEVAHQADGATLAAGAQALRSANPDVWLAGSRSSDAIPLARAAKAHGWSPRMVLARDAAAVDPATVEPPGAVPEGSLWCAAFAPDLVDRMPVAAALTGPYRSRAGEDLADRPARAFTGIVTLVDAINRAGSTEPEAIRAALVRTDIKAAALAVPWAGVKFDDNGQNVAVRAIVTQLQGGRAHTVWPFDVATREVRDPLGA